jgi:hypothetical protein
LAREQFILKIFYEFEEIEFKIAYQETFQSEFLFTLPEGYQVHIPIQLPETIEVINESKNLTFAIFTNPHYHTVNPLAEWHRECVTCSSGYALDDHGVSIITNFTLSIGEFPERLLNKQDLGEVFLNF